MNSSLPKSTPLKTVGTSAVVFVFFFLVFARHVAMFYPGYIPPDTLYMLAMGLGKQPLSNWHPPAVSLALGGIYQLFQHVGLIWLLQLVAYLTWIRSNAREYRHRITACLSAVVFACWPPLITNLAAIWKDAWAVIAMLYLFLAAKRAAKRHSRQSLLAAIAAALVATIVRPDYLLVALPLLGMAAWMTAPDSSRLREKLRPAVLAVFSLLILAAGVRIATGLLVEKRVNPWLTPAIWDAVGARVHDSSNDDGITVAGQTLQREELLRIYRDDSSDGLVFSQTLFNLPEAPEIRSAEEEARELRRLWVDAVFYRTTGYLRHRLAVCRRFLGIGSTDVHAPYTFGIIPNQFGFTFERSPANISVYWTFDRLAHGPFWRLWLYLVICGCCVGLLIATGSMSPLVPPLALTVLFAAARVMILPAADFRYGLWIVAGSILVLLETVDAWGWLGSFAGPTLRPPEVARTNSRSAN